MRNGFTMIELLVVMAIMAMLGVAASNGYSTLQRGMRERAAVAGASALLVSAKERAAVDRVPTAVFCYNKMIRDNSAANDENAVVVGVMTAIRRHGRLSYVRDKFLYDEFDDLELTSEALSDDEEFSSDGRTHSAADLDKRAGMRLWKFPTSENMEYSIVADAVWCDSGIMETIFSGGANPSTNCLMSAFYNLSRSDYEPTWKVGDAYGFEVGEIQLPHGFIFGQTPPSSVGRIQLVKTILFDPDDNSDKSVEICSTKPNASGMPVKFKAAGNASTGENRKL